MPRDTLKYESRILAFATSQLICKNGNFAIRKVKLDFSRRDNPVVNFVIYFVHKDKTFWN